jgi:long-chain acyl-CoA synthetase
MHGHSIADRFRAMAAARCGEPAIRLREAAVSYGELDQASDRVAAHLARNGLRPGDRVALYCPNCAEFAMAYLGIVKAGAVVVPINLLLSPREIAYIAGDAGAKALIYHEALGANVAAFRAQLPGLAFAICVGERPVEGADAVWCDVLATAADAPRAAGDPDADLAAVLYTSGTTGHPKGAMLSHRNLVSNTDSVVRALRLEPHVDRILVVLPMFHSFAATVGMLTPLLHGLSLVPVPRFDLALVSDAIESAGATVFLGVPSMYNLLLRLPEAHQRQWSSIRFGVSGGAAMPVEVMRRFEERFGFPVLEGDGPTECSPVTCVNPIDGPRKPASVGLPIPDVEIAIFDDAGAPLETGAIGEVCVRGPNVMRGYWGLPDATAEAFFGEWLRTGDLGYVDADGYVFLVDRKKDMIIVNGMNVYPRMIEEALYRLPGVGEAAVVGEPHESHGEIPVAYVVPASGASLDAAIVRAWCKENLGRHEVPRKVIFVEGLPKNAAGKILKRELRRGGELERGIDSRQPGG